MVLSSSFPSTLQRAFSHRRKNSGKDDVINAEIDGRKVSIDQTVSTREDSQQMNGMADIYRRPSYDLDFVDQPERARTDALIGDGRPNGDYDYHRRETMTHSHSDPAFYTQHTAAGHYSYVDYAPVPQHQQRLIQSFQGLGWHARSPLQPSPPPPMGLPPNYYSYGGTPQNDKVHVDPTLQARIEALQIQEQLLGLAHPDVIFALAGIAKLYEKRGDHAQAAKIMKESQMRSIMAKSAPQGNPNRSSNDVEDVPIEISFPR